MREAAKKFTNKKTLSETGFSYVTGNLSVHSPYGNSILRSQEAFLPGEEKKLEIEFDRLEEMISFASREPKKARTLMESLCLAKDISGSIKRSEAVTLSVVEIFEIKSFLLLCEEIRKIIGEGNFELIPVSDAIDVLDPKGDRMNTFYIYDEFSEKLAELRAEKKALDTEIRRVQKAKKDSIKAEYGIMLTPKFDIVIPKSSDDCEQAKNIDLLETVAEDYSSVTFALKADAETYKLIEKAENFNMAIEEEEENCCVRLSRRIWEYADVILENGRRIGYLDLMLAKANYSIEHKLVRPKIMEEHILSIKNGRHLQVEDILESRGKVYCPISMELREGVTCITGANMGGKTISLKLAGLIMLMTQYGYFVPADSAEVGLSNFMGILIGDSQSMERGLSSFGSEMEELKDILAGAKPRSLILVDEIASGTNPSEGQALTESLIDYLSEKEYISLMTTHFDVKDERAVSMQVRGLADADFRRLNSELSGADRNERIDIIGKYMDYNLALVETGEEVPKDALNIASMLGIPEEIIMGARRHLEKDKK
ncbi:MAG: hypothetical protein J5928_01865 [Firmicutes bacterium]|nr:hypothetical protein [Bacillota bacterium]